MSNVTYERVNWEDSPSQNTPINQTNLNKMDKGIDDCAKGVNDCYEQLEDCFTSVSNGKALIASAITGKGVETASDASFETIAQNIVRDLVHPTGTLNITSNGEHNVRNYEKANVNVSFTKGLVMDRYYYEYTNDRYMHFIYRASGITEFTIYETSGRQSIFCSGVTVPAGGSAIISCYNGQSIEVTFQNNWATFRFEY